MDPYKATTEHYVEHVRRGGDYENAVCGLVHQEKDILPHLINAYKTESEAYLRCFLVEVIWQHRDVSIVPFLGEALGDEAPEAWKQALDGLVALACPSARQVLRDAQARFQNRNDMQPWLNEAIDQVDDALELR